MFNRFVGVGNLTRDPEVRYTPSGMAVVTLPIAINTRHKNNGEVKEETFFIDVVVFNKQAETCAQYLSKGKMVLVEGRLRERRWEKDGVAHRKIELLANTVRFLSPKTDSAQSLSEVTEELVDEISDSEPF